MSKAAFRSPEPPNAPRAGTARLPERAPAEAASARSAAQATPRAHALKLGGLLVLTLLSQRDVAASSWLTPAGIGDLSWGTSSQPLEVVRRPRDLYLPDSGYVLSGPSDRPEDLELTGPHPNGERRFVRYVNGQLVDAWVLLEGSIDVSSFEAMGTLQWEGTVLGPASEGYRAFGDATSWQLEDRTVLHWRDRMSNTEVLVSRAQPTRTYAIRREAPLEPPRTGRVKPRLTGSLKPILKPWALSLSSCLDTASKPVIATLDLVYTPTGEAGRMRFIADQPTPGGLACMANSVVESSAEPGFTGQLQVSRHR